MTPRRPASLGSGAPTSRSAGGTWAPVQSFPRRWGSPRVAGCNVLSIGSGACRRPVLKRRRFNLSGRCARHAGWYRSSDRAPAEWPLGSLGVDEGTLSARAIELASTVEPSSWTFDDSRRARDACAGRVESRQWRRPHTEPRARAGATAPRSRGSGSWRRGSDLDPSSSDPGRAPRIGAVAMR